jgi:multiple sugar transport system permease protein
MGVAAVPEAPPSTTRWQRFKRVRFGGDVLLWIAVVVIIAFCLFPFYWLINTSLKTGADLSSANFVPPHPTLKNFQSIFQNDDFVKALRNSAIISLSTTLIALVIGSFAAYALARLRFPLKFLLLGVILSITTFPPIAIAAPVFKLWTDLGLYNTYLGLILPDLTFTLPLTIYILTSFFRDIPRELE